MSDELGMMNRDELIEVCEQPSGSATRLAAWHQELADRSQAFRWGAPGRAPMLSRAQCRAVLGPLLSPSDEPTWDSAIHACARALLNLGPDEKSPLEED